MKRCTMNCNFRLPPGEGERLIVWRLLQYAPLNRYEERAGRCRGVETFGEALVSDEVGRFLHKCLPVKLH